MEHEAILAHPIPTVAFSQSGRRADYDRGGDEMSFLTFFREDARLVQPPRRIYGRIDQFEPADELNGWDPVILIDSVDADWVDELGGEIRWLGDPDTLRETDRRISVVEVRGGRLPGMGSWFPTDEGEWIELEFTAGDDVAHYLNLFAAPIQRGVRSARQVPHPTRERLEKLTSIDDLGVASEDDLRGALGGPRAGDAVAVYDVGHGNCNGLIDGGAVSLYFDFGGGVLRNRGTFPAALTHFCMCGHPVVVLSHWDYDHWSSGQRDPRALGLTWIVPHQKLGPTHITFLGQIHATGRALVWPPQLSQLVVGDVSIERCTGPPRSRNDSGLAIAVTQSDGSRMLLPADAGYNHVPSASGSFASLTVPHHGGRTPSSSVPASDARASGRCAYSTGAGNSYHHPYRNVVLAHAAAWAHDLYTEHRDPSGLGHIHLYWDPQTTNAHPACGATTCQLTCHQR
jgi:hypothetical protein